MNLGLLQRLVHLIGRTTFGRCGPARLRKSCPRRCIDIIDRSGRTRWVNQRNVLVTGDDGRPVAIEGIATDVTRQKEAEQELRMSEQRFRRLFDQTPLGVALRETRLPGSRRSIRPSAGCSATQRRSRSAGRSRP